MWRDKCSGDLKEHLEMGGMTVRGLENSHPPSVSSPTFTPQQDNQAYEVISTKGVL